MNELIRQMLPAYRNPRIQTAHPISADLTDRPPYAVSVAVGLLCCVGVINPHRDLRGPRVIRHSRGTVRRKNNARGSR